MSNVAEASSARIPLRTRQYEATFVLRTDQEALERGKQSVQSILSSVAARTVRENDVGERQLAYPIDKQERGYYTFYELQIDPQRVQEIKQAVALVPDVLKCFIVRGEPLVARPAVARTAGG